MLIKKTESPQPEVSRHRRQPFHYSMMSLERIPDQIGYLVLTEDGAVIASGGELENSEHVANVITGLISLADSILPDEEGYKKISVTYTDCSYIICLSNKKIYVVKKRFTPQNFNIENDVPAVVNSVANPTTINA